MVRNLTLVLTFLLIAALGAAAADKPPIDLEALGFESFDGHRAPAPGLAADAVPFTLVKGEIADMMFMATGDFNGDGWPDLVFSGWIEDTYIAWGNGDGSFDAAELLDSTAMTAFATGYVNADNYLDLLSVTDGSVKVWLNNGDGTFTSSRVASASGTWRSIATGYFNNDTYLDIVVTPGVVYVGDGTGGFTHAGALPSGGLENFAVADFNQDGHDDLVGVGSQYIYLLRNDGSGSFTITDSHFTGQESISVSTAKALADFNGDGYPDFATITPLIGIDKCPSNNYWRSVITVCYGGGAGDIMAADTFSVCGTSYNMFVTDVDRDGILDFAVANGSEHQLEVFLGDGAGDFTWSFAQSFETDSITFSLASDDLDADGNPDFVAGGGLPWSDNIISVINGSPDPQLTGKSLTATGYGAELEVVTPDAFQISRLVTTAGGGQHLRRDFNTDGTLDEAAFDPSTIYGDYDVVIKAMPDAAPGATFDADVALSDGTHAVLFKNYLSPATPIVFTYPMEASSAVAPGSGLPSNTLTPTFEWSGLVGSGVTPDMYEFQLDDTWDFSSPALMVDETGLVDPQYALGTSLTAENVYYWRVRWYVDGAWSDYSTTFAAYATEMLCGDVNGDGVIEVTDLTFLVAYLFQAGPNPPNPNAADVTGQDGINIGDLTYLVQYLFVGDFPPTGCPQ